MLEFIEHRVDGNALPVARRGLHRAEPETGYALRQTGEDSYLRLRYVPRDGSARIVMRAGDCYGLRAEPSGPRWRHYHSDSDRYGAIVSRQVVLEAVGDGFFCAAEELLDATAELDRKDVAAVRRRLIDNGAPWIIENVPGAPLRHGVVLCGAVFSLGATGPDGTYRPLRRHRLFESSEPLLTPPCHCDRREKLGVYGGSDGGKKQRGNGQKIRRGGYQGTTQERREGMGIEWMRRQELSLAIPPAYTEYLGRQLLAALREVA